MLAATNPGSLTRLLLGGPSRSEMQVVESGQLQIFRTGSNIRVPADMTVHSDTIQLTIVRKFTWTRLKTGVPVAALVIFPTVLNVWHQFSRSLAGHGDSRIFTTT